MTESSRRARAARIIGLVSALLAGVYLALGWILGPVLAQHYLWPELSARTGARWASDFAFFSPLRGKFDVAGFRLETASGVRLAAVDSASADVAVMQSLWERRLIATVRLSGLKLQVDIGPRGDTNFDALLGGAKSSSGFAMPFRFSEIRLEGARIAVTEGSGTVAAEMVFSPLSLVMRGLASEPGATASFELDAGDDSAGQFHGEGSMQLAPITSVGSLRAERISLAHLSKFLSKHSGIVFKDGNLALGAAYRFSSGKDGPACTLEGVRFELFRVALAHAEDSRQLGAAQLKAEISKLAWPERRLVIDSISVHGASLRSLGSASPPAADGSLELTNISVRDAVIDLSARSLDVEAISFMGGHALLRREPDGHWVWPGQGWLPNPSGESESRLRHDSVPAWRAKVSDVDFADLALDFQDRGVQAPVQWEVTAVNGRLRDLNSEPGSATRVSLKASIGKHGLVDLDGKVVPLPVVVADFNTRVEGLELRQIHPYLSGLAGVTIVRGRVNLSGDVDFYQGPTDSLRFSGRANVLDLKTQDRRDGKDLLKWKDLALNGLIFETIPKRLSIREIAVSEPQARVFVAADGTINIAEALAAHPETAVKPGAGEDLAIVVGALRIADGRVDFTDESLKPLSFATQIQQLNGNIRGLSSQRAAKADLLLEGKINDRSPVKISGQVNPFSLGTYTDVLMQFRDVNLTTLSPYSGKFAGYRIEKGKLSMNLRYKLEDGKLEGENELSFDHLVLGERVESQDATSLPVQFAVALLKDREGRIDVSLPVSGDLRDPQVSIRGLLAGAMTQLLGKLVGSPFAVLGRLFEDGKEDLAAVAFEPGKDALSPDEQSKLAKVSIALNERPGLLLDIQGVADEKSDRSAIAERELLRQLRRLRRAEPDFAEREDAATEKLVLSEGDFARLFTEFCWQQSPVAPELAGLTRPGASLSGHRLADAKRRVLANWPVGELELRGLAMARGERIRRYMISPGGLSDQRIYLLDAKFTATDARKIKAMLSLSAP